MTRIPWWSTDEIERRVAKERDLFVDFYKSTTRHAYMEVEALCRAEVLELMRATDMLRTLGDDPDIFRGKGSAKLLRAARYITSPAISSDTLKIVAKSEGVAGTIVDFLDTDRFPWLATGAAIDFTDPQVEYAISLTTKLMAQQRAATEARKTASKIQESRVRSVLAGIKSPSLRFVEPGELRHRVKDLGDDPKQGLTATNYMEVLKRGEFTKEFRLAGAKCDVPVRLPTGDLLPIECKVSNTEVNSVKRINRETGGKHDHWRNTFSSSLHTGAVVRGVFKRANLEQAQAGGILLFFDHELEQSLPAFIKAGGRPS